ncbi:hypothetical protein OsJ_09701 [Oryza sativa Japonica Group]|uniref:Peptidase A1 domain-containing protein n=1 Tax=Oryza sativa subsp. japonica TaxID=39947 RepID=B9F5K6_ORYSJ|nr:hypothetical protein OsJ_09701 [Oryza sativa Japonica Group]
MAATTTIPLLLLLLAATVAAAAAELSVYHNVHPSSPSPLESIIALARDDDARLLFLSSKAATAGVSSAPVASGQAPPSYVVRAGLGSPSQQLLLALDTSADATARRARRRRGGGDAAPPPATLPTCAFSKPFADASFQAALASDTLRLGKDAIPNYTFGCVSSVTGPTTNMPRQGLLGLGRGPMALLSQAGSLYNGRLPLLPPELQVILLLRACSGFPAGSFAFDAATGAGTVVDSGTVITRWTAPVYAALREEFRRQVAAPSGYTSLGAFDTCFNTDEVAAGGAPAVTVHMDGGVDLALPMENTLIHSSATPLACLAMAEAPQNVNSVVNVIANLQQQNIRVVFDVANSRVGFAKESCN